MNAECAAQLLSAEIKRTGLPLRRYYREIYLHSEHWEDLRSRVLCKASACAKCGLLKPLDVHHLRYRNLFDVQSEDLLPLCRDCHNVEHGRQGPQMSERLRVILDRKNDERIAVAQARNEDIRKRRKAFAISNRPDNSLCARQARLRAAGIDPKKPFMWPASAL